MADPTQNLPLITNFVPRGPTIYGNPGVLVPQQPVPNNFVPRFDTNAHGYTGVPPVTPPIPQVATAATPSTPPAATPAAAATTAAPAVPVAPPAATTTAASATAGVSPTPGEGNPLPPGQPGGVTLPVGPVGNSALAGVGTSTFGGGGVAQPTAAGNAPTDDGPEIIRGGAVSGGPVGGGGFVVPSGAGMRDPQAAIYSGFDAQTQRAEGFIQQAMNYVNGGGDIFERATRGRFVNGLLQATVGPNNVGQVQGQGQDTLNSAIAGITSAGLGANAGITEANINQQTSGERNAAAQKLQSQQIESQPVVIGQRQVKNALGLPVMEPIYGVGTVGADGSTTGYRPINGAGMVLPTPSAVQQPATLPQSASRTRADGTRELTNDGGKTWRKE